VSIRAVSPAQLPQDPQGVALHGDAGPQRGHVGLDLDQVDGSAVPGEQDGRGTPGGTAADDQHGADATDARHGNLLGNLTAVPLGRR
jgi:hypothetical protein